MPRKATPQPKPDAAPKPKRFKRQYSDAEKASALLALEANGGNVKGTARQLGIPVKTLGDWSKDQHVNESVAEIRHEKRPDLIDRFMSEIDKALEAMGAKRTDASYADLARTIGIFTDKMQLLKGAATERGEHRVVVLFGDGGDDAPE